LVSGARWNASCSALIEPWVPLDDEDLEEAALYWLVDQVTSSNLTHARYASTILTLLSRHLDDE
jgi:hypothetical protein